MTSFERYTRLTLMNVDFLAIRPILQETDHSRIQISQQQNQITVLHTSNDKKMEYRFDTRSLRLTSIFDHNRKRLLEYSDYRTRNGLTFAGSVTKFYDGNDENKGVPSFITWIEEVKIIDKVEAEKLQLPDGYGPVIPESDKTLTAEKIAADLYLVTDASASRNTLFKVNGDDIMMFGAPVSNKRSEETIALIQRQFPNKKITSVYVTLPYSDHIAGLPAYAAIGAKILADAYSIDAIKHYPRFAEVTDTFKFKTIEHQHKLDGVQFFVLENSRAKRQSFAYFPQQQIIYQSDFLEVAFDNTIAKVYPSYSKAFLDFIASQELTIKRVVGQHRNNNIRPEILSKIALADTI
jgi:hypothetical protein